MIAYFTKNKANYYILQIKKSILYKNPQNTGKISAIKGI